jgi:predicted transcriptional regulator of viral defense system
MTSKIATLYKSTSTVFTYRDVAWLWRERSPKVLHEAVGYYVKKGDLIRLTRGLFAKPIKPGSPLAKYDPLELAGKLADLSHGPNKKTGRSIPPSYVSFETALLKAGASYHQGKRLNLAELRRQTTFFVATHRSRTVGVDGRTYVFRKLKDSVLFNRSGLTVKNRWAMAGLERAFLDTLYLKSSYYFDFLTDLDWEKCFKLVSLYDNQSLVRRLKQYHRAYNEQIDYTKFKNQQPFG